MFERFFLRVHGIPRPVQRSQWVPLAAAPTPARRVRPIGGATRQAAQAARGDPTGPRALPCDVLSCVCWHRRLKLLMLIFCVLFFYPGRFFGLNSKFLNPKIWILHVLCCVCVDGLCFSAFWSAPDLFFLDFWTLNAVGRICNFGVWMIEKECEPFRRQNLWTPHET